MPWAKIEFTGPQANRQAQWFRATFLQLVLRLPDVEADHMGLYLGKNADQEPIFYLAPLAVDALTAAMPNYVLAPGDRPAPGLFVAFGGYHASDPAWFDLPADERERQLEETRLSPQEAALWHEDLLGEVGWADDKRDLGAEVDSTVEPQDPGQGNLWGAG
jgi:hypothetical protein